MRPIDFDYLSPTNETWQDIIAPYLQQAKTFEIHCWQDESQAIKQALIYGELKESGWPYGEVIMGDVTPEFTNYLLTLPKPQDTEIYNKMTPFFSIFLDDIFSSSHYGTELYGE